MLLLPLFKIYILSGMVVLIYYSCPPLKRFNSRKFLMKNTIEWLAGFLLIITFTGMASGHNENINNIENNLVVKKLKITTLSTMLASRGLGEWGYSALVEVDGKKILFDTGGRPQIVLQNAKELGVDLSDVEDVFLSHNHGDHTGGLLTLREAFKNDNPKAFSRIHVGDGIFAKRVNYHNDMIDVKKTLEADGVKFIVHNNNHEIFPGVWITGPIARIHNEKNWNGRGKIETSHGQVEDIIAEDQSLAINTKNGFVLVSGCGHAGIINTMEHVHQKIQNKPIYAAVGGFHLVNASDEHLKWTADKLESFGVSKIVGAHCTGINALYTLKQLLGLSRSDAVVGTVGDHFDSETGIKAGYIAR